MGLDDFKQYVVIRVPNPVDEADFFARIFDSAPLVVNETTRQLGTGAFVLRITQCDSPADCATGLHFEVNVPNVNKFAEDVWNRGVKYASRPQNFKDGFRRVGFVSPGEVRLDGVGPLKLDSTGAFASYRDSDE